MSSKQLCGKSLDFHENKDGSFQPNLNFETIAETVLLLFYVSFEEYQNIYYTVSFIEVTLRNHKQQKKKITANFNNCNESTIKKYSYFKTLCHINV